MTQDKLNILRVFLSLETEQKRLSFQPIRKTALGVACNRKLFLIILKSSKYTVLCSLAIAFIAAADSVLLFIASALVAQVMHSTFISNFTNLFFLTLWRRNFWVGCLAFLAYFC